MIKIERRGDRLAHGQKGVKRVHFAFGLEQGRIMHGDRCLLADAGKEKQVVFVEGSAVQPVYHFDHTPCLVAFEEGRDMKYPMVELALLCSSAAGSSLFSPESAATTRAGEGLGLAARTCDAATRRAESRALPPVFTSRASPCWASWPISPSPSAFRSPLVVGTPSARSTQQTSRVAASTSHRLHACAPRISRIFTHHRQKLRDSSVELNVRLMS